MRAKPGSTADYLAGLDAKPRAALQRLRRIIRTAVPQADECISYGIPAFRMNGRVLVWYAAAARHCSLFPGAHPIHVYRNALKPYDTSKGTVRFRPEQPLPATLVRKLVRARATELSQKRASRKGAAARRTNR